MKKTIFTFLLLALIMPVSVGATEPILENSYSLLVVAPKITQSNYNTTINHHKITQTWLTNQFMTTKLTVIDHNRKTNYVFEDQFYFIATYHVVSFSLPEGEYTLIPESKDYKTNQVFYGVSVNITVK